jgi:hypothetical protein
MSEELIRLEDIKLTPRQDLFVEHYTNASSPGFNNATKSAELAGYEGDYETLRAIGSENLTKPNISLAVRYKRQDLRKLFRAESNRAFQVILEIINNPKVSPRTRLDACKDVLDRAGYKPTDKLELSGVDGNPIEYETRLTREIASRAKSLLLETNMDDVEMIDVTDVLPIDSTK